MIFGKDYHTSLKARSEGQYVKKKEPNVDRQLIGWERHKQEEEYVGRIFPDIFKAFF